MGLIGDHAWADYLAKEERAQKLAAFLEKTRVSSDLLEKIGRAQQERLAVQSTPNAGSTDEANEPSDSQAAASSATGGNLSSALGAPLTQLLKRPQIVIEDLAAVVREGYPEFFAEIAAAAEVPADSRQVSGHEQPMPLGIGERNEKDQTSVDPSGFSPWKLSAAARNEMKTVETEIKYAGYLDQQRKSIERLKKAEQRVIPEWFDYGKVSGLSREMNEKLQRVRPRTLGHASRIPGVTPAAVSLINVYIEIQAKRFAQAAQSAG